MGRRPYKCIPKTSLLVADVNELSFMIKNREGFEV